MSRENISQEFRLKNIDRNESKYIEIYRNELVSKKNKKVLANLNSIENFFILLFTITGCISISAFVFLIGIP